MSRQNGKGKVFYTSTQGVCERSRGGHRNWGWSLSESLDTISSTPITFTDSHTSSVTFNLNTRLRLHYLLFTKTCLTTHRPSLNLNFVVIFLCLNLSNLHSRPGKFRSTVSQKYEFQRFAAGATSVVKSKK